MVRRCVLPAVLLGWVVLYAQPASAIVVGVNAGLDPTTPADHVDPNTTVSPWAGVGSVFFWPNFAGSPSGYLGTGTPLDSTHILTAAHVVDSNNNGIFDGLEPAVAPDPTVAFFLNYGSDLSHVRVASAITIHPDFTGFANPVVNDDLCILTLASAIPAAVPVYPVYNGPMAAGTTLTQVGYGTTGTGATGFGLGADPTVKRVGQNSADEFFLDDEAPNTAVEVFEFDFDDGTAGHNLYGDAGLGNSTETTLGPGDSGGPSFINDGGVWKIAGVNTYGKNYGIAPPFFGSAGGGILLSGYIPWLESSVGPIPPSPGPIVPEPTSMALLATGLGMVLSRRRKRSV